MPKWDKTFLEKAHKKSIFNKSEIMRSNICGCFYCLKVYPPAEIVEWVNEGKEKEQTPLCPYCGIDSVLGNASQLPVSNVEFLKTMQKKYF